MDRVYNVLDQGFVRLDGALADDLSVVNAARVSFGNRKDLMDESDVGLVKYLMRERHGTPFEHNSFRFHVKCPMFVAREWFRHRISSFNERSGRYSKLEAEFYIPNAEDVRTQVGKPGAYTFEPHDNPEGLRLVLGEVAMDAWQAYEYLLEQGYAKELARCVLPVNIYTEFYWTVNARSMMNFLSLRLHETAQLEIRRYAEAVSLFFSQEMPITYAAWIANERVAP
jgi:thymidylate synthase (FAD)